MLELGRGEKRSAEWIRLRLYTASVLLSICASARRNGRDPWAYLKHVLSELPARAAVADLDDLLPDNWTGTLSRTESRADALS